MWVDPADPTPFANLGGTAKACGLTPFCSPQKPCRLTPNCGKPVSVNPQTLMLTHQNAAASSGGNFANGMATARGVNPVNPNGAVADGTLVSRGIVPGASTVTSGGMVVAIGVATPAGTMTPVGVRLPNGMVNNTVVLRACVMTPNCTAAHPCGLTPNCGGAVAVNRVSNNATVLASALQAQGVAGGVMQAGGMGMLVNPMTNQPINGITMGGYPQMGYPPIGYAPIGYAPGYPHYAAGLGDTDEPAAEISDEEEVIPPETRSAMPVPRFQPIPSKPAFQRSEGMSPTPKAQRTVAKPTTVSMSDLHEVSEKEFETALDQAYLEGVSAAMDEVERKLAAKRQVAARAKLQEKILQQAENVQQQLEEQEELRMLALQRAQHERQLRQRAVQTQSEMMAATEALLEPKRLPTPKQAAVLPDSPRETMAAQSKQPQSPVVAVKASSKNVSPVQLAENLKTSVASGVNGLFAPLLGTNQKDTHSTKSQPRQNVNSGSEFAVTPPNLPKRPPVSPVPMDYGLLPDDEPAPLILQTRFTADDELVRP